ncbi:MAG: hypothetical protein JJ896_01395 [Rhodothermales bacterium]|nr:hypothetical protein [Rhodothermales bacterium]MBO6778283.1 hypothetical protein [Rhodothermales bacterium]
MTPNIQPAQVRLIRLALLSGIVLFGLVALFIAGQADHGVTLNADGPLAGFVALLVILAAGVVMLFRRRIDGAASYEERARMLIIAYAACELAALVGAVHLLMTGGMLPYIAGVVVYLFALVLLPVEAPA